MIDFSNFTLNNQGVTDLNKVLFTTAFVESDLFQTCSLQTQVKNGAILDYVDNMGIVGKAGRGCDPTYDSVAVKGLEKQWNLDDWEIAKKICYTELENTIARWALRAGTAKDDIIGTDFWNKIYLPFLDKALTEFFWRTAWFADKDAKNVSDSGVITDDVDLSHLKITDGLFKRLFAIIGANAKQKTTIAANAEATTAAQKTAIKGEGVALDILDNILSDADSRIAPNGGKLMVTNSLYQAFRRDYTKRYKDTIPFTEVAEGVKLPTYDGIPVLPVAEWDSLINTYENNGTKLNNPHRAVFANPDNLIVGTSATDTLSSFDTFFDKKDRQNYTYAANDLGTLVGEDALVHVAI